MCVEDGVEGLSNYVYMSKLFIEWVYGICFGNIRLDLLKVILVCLEIFKGL